MSLRSATLLFSRSSASGTIIRSLPLSPTRLIERSRNSLYRFTLPRSASNLGLPSDSTTPRSDFDSRFRISLPSGWPLNRSLMRSQGGRLTSSLGTSSHGQSPRRASAHRTLPSNMHSASLRPIMASSPSPSRSTRPSLASVRNSLLLVQATAVSEESTICMPRSSLRVSSRISLGVEPSLRRAWILIARLGTTPPATAGSANGKGIPEWVRSPASTASSSVSSTPPSTDSLRRSAYSLKPGGIAANERVAGGLFEALLRVPFNSSIKTECTSLLGVE